MPLLHPLCDETTRPGIVFIHSPPGLYSANLVTSNIRHRPRSLLKKRLARFDSALHSLGGLKPVAENEELNVRAEVRTLQRPSPPGLFQQAPRQVDQNKVGQVDQNRVDFNYDHGAHFPDPFERVYANTPLH